MIIHDPRPTARQRQLAEMGAQVKTMKNMGGEKTVLGRKMNDHQTKWLLQYLTDRWTTLHRNLSSQRAAWEIQERESRGNYSDRKKRLETDVSDALRSIFEHQNESLGVASGFSDFAFAQAKGDIFGTKPWLAATPQGVKDNDLADILPKHCQWKFDQSDLQETLTDGILTACDIGTAFVKIGWLKDIEQSTTVDFVAHSKSKNAPLEGIGGDMVRDHSELPEDVDGADVEWRQMELPDISVIYDNLTASLLDFRDVAFDTLAPELNLRHTEFFHRFRIGLLDAVSLYKLDEKEHIELRSLILTGTDQLRADREEESSNQTAELSALEANPQIELIEGFTRVDPFQKNNPVRIHAVFAPSINLMLRAEYLKEDTPGGMLPVFAVRCFKVPNRIIGRGYLEKYHDANMTVDTHFNTATYIKRQSCFPIKGMHVDAVEDELDQENLILDPNKTYVLKPDKTMADFLSFAQIPENSKLGLELLDRAHQMAQMHSGITSAAQGEMKGVPSSNTATGTNEIISRGAQLLKVPISQMASDLTNAVEFSVFLVYANQTDDETFTWGEGKDAEVKTINAGDVKGLRLNVSLSLTLSQNQTKLKNAQGAIQIMAQYVQLPENEKTAQRRMFIEAVKALEFNDADKIVREAVTDVAGIMAMLPPELQPLFQQFLATMQAQQGQGMPPDGQQPPMAPDGTQPSPESASSQPDPNAPDPATFPEPPQQ